MTRSARFAWFVVTIGLLSAIALGLYGFLRGGFGRDTHADWLRLSDELRKNGEPLYLADVKPADVPDDQNFFAADVFAGLAEDAPRDPLLQRAVDPGRGLRVADLLAAATQGGGASLDAIAATMQRAGLVKARTDFLLAGDRVRAGMRALGLDFTSLATAADRPGARFPIDYTQPFPKLPHLRPLEALGDWLAIRAIAQLSTGDSDAAALDLLLIGRLADSLAGEPFLPSQRTRRLLLGLFAGCVRVGIGWNAWSDEQLGRFVEALERARLLTDLGWALRGERAQVNTAINLAISGRKPSASAALQGWLGTDLVRLDMRGLRARQVAINRAMQEILDALGRPDGLRPASLEIEDVPNLPAAARERFQALTDDARVSAQLQTYLAQAQIACAIERFRFARGALPEKLEALAPEFLPSIPADPLTGEPPAYERRAGGGYVLTGVGWTDGQPWVWARDS
ncbi:MAG: hypothetical protein PHC88_12750 [Terrimicrobiaceae bacterium]|nr:hypothetical protein [Terrimicrobiaceae bacterium]